MQLVLQTEVEEGVSFVRCIGNIFETDGADQLMDYVDGLAASQPSRKIVLDLREVHNADLVGAAAIAVCAAATGAGAKVVTNNDQIRTLLALTKTTLPELDKVKPFNSCDEAVLSFQT